MNGTSLITGDAAAIPLCQWDFGEVMGLCRDPITVPENHYPISSSVLLSSSLHFSIAHTTAFFPPCTLPRMLHWCYVVYKAQNWKIEQYQINICTCNLKSAHFHICAVGDTGVLVHGLNSCTKLGQNLQEKTRKVLSEF